MSGGGWIFNPPEGGPGGGSSFAHLVEDELAGNISGDWSIILGGESSYASFGVISPDDVGASHLVFSAGHWSDNYDRFEIRHDGTFWWGSGASALDLSAGRDPATDELRVKGAGLSVHNAVDAALARFPSSGGLYLDGITGAGIRMAAPDGTAYLVTVTNDGTLDVTAA